MFLLIEKVMGQGLKKSWADSTCRFWHPKYAYDAIIKKEGKERKGKEKEREEEKGKKEREGEERRRRKSARRPKISAKRPSQKLLELPVWPPTQTSELAYWIPVLSLVPLFVIMERLKCDARIRSGCNDHTRSCPLLDGNDVNTSYSIFTC